MRIWQLPMHKLVPNPLAYWPIPYCRAQMLQQAIGYLKFHAFGPNLTFGDFASTPGIIRELICRYQCHSIPFPKEDWTWDVLPLEQADPTGTPAGRVTIIIVTASALKRGVTILLWPQGRWGVVLSSSESPLSIYLFYTVSLRSPSPGLISHRSLSNF